MILNKKKYVKIFSILFILIIIALLVNVSIKRLEKKNEVIAKEPIIINLLTSVHPSLPWRFNARKEKIIVKPGEVKTIEYYVENLDTKESTGIATFAYFPNEFEALFSLLSNDFCCNLFFAILRRVFKSSSVFIFNKFKQQILQLFEDQQRPTD